MTRRTILLGAATWTLAYGGLYLAIIRAQGDSGVVWWYVALLGLTVTLMVVATFTPDRRRLGLAALVMATVSALVAMMSIGMLLVPAIVGVSFGLRSTADRRDLSRDQGPVTGGFSA